MVWLDQLARSLKQLIETLEGLDVQKIGKPRDERLSIAQACSQ